MLSKVVIRDVKGTNQDLLDQFNFNQTNINQFVHIIDFFLGLLPRRDAPYGATPIELPHSEIMMPPMQECQGTHRLRARQAAFIITKAVQKDCSKISRTGNSHYDRHTAVMLAYP